MGDENLGGSRKTELFNPVRFVTTVTFVNAYQEPWTDSMKPHLPIGALFILLTFCSSPVTNAQTWNRFHGSSGQGSVSDAALPEAFTEPEATEESIQQAKSWSVELGSRDVGSPIIHGDTCYLLVSVPAESQIQIQSRDVATGQLRWSKSFEQSNYHLHRRNTLAPSTPTTDSEHVYFSYADSQHTWLIALNHDGQVQWKRDFGTWQSSHGYGTSPTVLGDKVVLLLSQQALQLDSDLKPGDSRLIAVSTKSGEDVWTTKLKATRSCYGIPARYQENGRTLLLGANTGNGLFGVDAETGKMVWEKTAFDLRCCSTPLVVDGVAIGTSGSGGGGNHLVAVRIHGADGQPETLYRIDKFAPYVPTPAVHDGHLYCVDDRGIASCIRVADGELVWKQRLGGNFGASPIIIGDHVLMTSLDGTTHVIKASTTYKNMNRFELGGPVGASPAFEDGRILIRVGETLNCWSRS